MSGRSQNTNRPTQPGGAYFHRPKRAWLRTGKSDNPGAQTGRYLEETVCNLDYRLTKRDNKLIANRGRQQAKEFRNHRRRLGLTQTSLAWRLDVNVQTIQCWEEGRFSIPEATLKRLRRIRSA